MSKPIYTFLLFAVCTLTGYAQNNNIQNYTDSVYVLTQAIFSTHNYNTNEVLVSKDIDLDSVSIKTPYFPNLFTEVFVYRDVITSAQLIGGYRGAIMGERLITNHIPDYVSPFDNGEEGTTSLYIPYHTLSRSGNNLTIVFNYYYSTSEYTYPLEDRLTLKMTRLNDLRQ